MTLLVATTNLHKLREIRGLLAELPSQIMGLRRVKLVHVVSLSVCRLTPTLGSRSANPVSEALPVGHRPGVGSQRML